MLMLVRYPTLNLLAARPLGHQILLSLMSFYELNFVQKGPLMGEFCCPF